MFQQKLREALHPTSGECLLRAGTYTSLLWVCVLSCKDSMAIQRTGSLPWFMCMKKMKTKHPVWKGSVYRATHHSPGRWHLQLWSSCSNHVLWGPLPNQSPQFWVESPQLSAHCGQPDHGVHTAEIGEREREREGDRDKKRSSVHSGLMVKSCELGNESKWWH